MSNYHVLDMHEKGHTVRIAFHVAVPDELNFSGVNFRVAVKQALSPVSVIPWLETGNPTEYAAIQNGETFEHVETLRFNANLTLANKKTFINNVWMALDASLPNALKKKYKIWGLDYNVT